MAVTAMITAVTVGEQAFLISNVILIIVILQRQLNGLFCQNRAVDFMHRQSIQRFGHRAVGELHSLADGFTLDQFRGYGAGGESGSLRGRTDW